MERDIVSLHLQKQRLPNELNDISFDLRERSGPSAAGRRHPLVTRIRAHERGDQRGRDDTNPRWRPPPDQSRQYAPRAMQQREPGDANDHHDQRDRP